ncbi:hypothetical protein G6F57_015480 [Rhizopus arrhizus]|nr:hypothetical protein G6F60_015066 [Rhizopus arrhizus]KAG1454553.1 hypothetical protein G6F57_015480 [Rhizopus arrhizus]
MGLVQRALRVFALLLGGLQLLAEAGQLLFQLSLAILQLLDLLAQFVDLTFAQQCALLGRTRARNAQPALAQALAALGDDRIAFGQAGLQRLRLGQITCTVQVRQQATDRGRATHAAM